MRGWIKKSVRDTLLGAMVQEDAGFLASRRKFLRTSALLASSLVLPSRLPAGGAGCRIAIVGAGIAGLHAAHLLKKKGLSAAVYEASGRVGGRMMTMRDTFGPGLHAEIGGEFIDPWHDDILGLAREFGLELLDLRADDPSLQSTLFFDGRLHSEEELMEEIQPFAGRLREDLERFPTDLDTLSWRDASAWSAIDQMSLSAYLDSIGMRGWVREYYCRQMASYYTMDAGQQSAVNLFLLLDLPGGEAKEPSEVLKIREGNDTLVRRIGESLGDQIHLGYALQEIHRTRSRGFSLFFENRGRRRRVEADLVLLALPFTRLREVKTIGFSWSARKEACIQTLGYGNGAKIFLGTKERTWRRNGFDGGFLSDTAAASGWDSSRMQDGETGIITVFGGGAIGTDAETLSAAELKQKYSDSLEKCWPGFKTACQGNIQKFSWQDYPFNRGSYTAYQPGQWTLFGGLEKEPEGDVFFAGEHCSVTFQGYMNGGAQTGRLAAEAMLKKLLIKC